LKVDQPISFRKLSKAGERTTRKKQVEPLSGAHRKPGILFSPAQVKKKQNKNKQTKTPHNSWDMKYLLPQEWSKISLD